MNIIESLPSYYCKALYNNFKIELELDENKMFTYKVTITNRTTKKVMYKGYIKDTGKSFRSILESTKIKMILNEIEK